MHILALKKLNTLNIYKLLFKDSTNFIILNLPDLNNKIFFQNKNITYFVLKNKFLKKKLTTKGVFFENLLGNIFILPFCFKSKNLIVELQNFNKILNFFKMQNIFFIEGLSFGDERFSLSLFKFILKFFNLKQKMFWLKNFKKFPLIICKIIHFSFNFTHLILKIVNVTIFKIKCVKLKANIV